MSQHLTGLIVGVTAHRDIPASQHEAVRDVLRQFFAGLQRDYPDLPLTALSPLAPGGDQLFAEVALENDLPLIVPLPFDETEYIASFENESEKRNYNRLAARARVVHLPPTGDEQFNTSGLYARLGMFVSSHSHILVAIWDGEESTQVGGTFQVVNYHHHAYMLGTGIEKIPKTKLLADSENDLAYHIHCGRESTATENAAVFGEFFTSDIDRPRSENMPFRYVSILKNMALFNRDAAHYADRIAPSSEDLISDKTAAILGDDFATLRQLFKTADWLAQHIKKRFDQFLLLTYINIVCMGLVFVAYSSSDMFAPLIYLYLVLLSFAFVLFRVSANRDWHRRYLDYRALAEGLRVQFFWKLAHVATDIDVAFAYDNFLQKQDIELAWIRDVMRAGELATVIEDNTSRDDGLEITLREWVGDYDRLGGQLGYYKARSTQRIRNYNRTRALAKVALWIGTFLAIVLALPIEKSPLLWLLLVEGMGVFTLIAAVREAYTEKKADKELVKQYRFMSGIFRNARRRIDMTRDDALRRRILLALGQACLDEHAEWILVHRERPLEQGTL